MKNIFIFLISITFLSLSCERNETKNSVPPPKKTEKVKMEIDQLNDSISKVWALMIKSDDQKIADIKRLLQEISYTDKPSVIELMKLQKLQEQLASKRYDQETMAESKKIDDYDMATDSLIKRTLQLTASTAGIESHPLAQELADDIMEADTDVVRYRAMYDSYVKRYNAYISKNEKQLKKLGEPYASFKKKPLFELGSGA
jgi:predicted  nucleic acid-binding Zn-ribbon protein